jgi:hypothetical protein
MCEQGPCKDYVIKTRTPEAVTPAVADMVHTAFHEGLKKFSYSNVTVKPEDLGEYDGDFFVKREQMKFETKDTGDRLEYDSGMVRDTNGGKPRFDLMIPKGIPFEELYLTRIAQLYRRGAVKYTERNWEKADSQEELDRALESAFRHFMQWYAGETDEDHAAAVFFNINEAETIKSKRSEDRNVIVESEIADTW